ncbi:hypothetical protein O3P69_007764 [Scylla paramamosain]|uniref:Uncharacterized protein n=1 Tax=Scylla paramamosain TaxID=85552 RepID=A0AAW0UYH0_SCYPA
MTGEVAGFTPEHEVQGSKRSRIRRIVVCVTLITLVGLAVVVGLAVTYASADSSGLIVYPDTFIDLDPNYMIGDKSAKQHYIDVLKDFEAAYTDATPSAQNLADCSFSYKLRDGMECRYEFMWLGSACNQANNFGYMDDQPCIVLAFNEPREWTPKPYTSPEELPKEMPESLRTHIESLFASSHPTQSAR